MKEKTIDYLKTADKQQLAEIKWLLENPEYEERPVDIETFVNHKYYLGLEFMARGKRGFGCRPRVLSRLVDIFDADKKYEEFVLNCGIGWGKDFTSSIVLCYQLYRLMVLKDPQKFFGLAPGTSIHLMLMSINESHARDVLFGEVKARMNNSEWFKLKCKFNPRITTEMQFAKNIYLIPGNSKDTTFVGYNIFTAIIDEGDDYTVTKTRNDAIEGYNAIKDRIVSRFRDRGPLGIIGSPKTIEGFMMNMYRNAEGIPNRYRVHVPTWDSLLDTEILSGESFTYKKLTVPIEYQQRFKSDPERAYRDLGARPSLAKQPFITLDERVDDIFTDKELLFIPKKDKVGSFARFTKNITGDPKLSYFAHLDLAVNRSKGDRLGFSVGHISGWETIDNQHKPVVEIDIAMVITAPPGGEIIFSDVKQLVFFLQDKGFNFKRITSDSWNSVDILQTFRGRGIFAEIVSVDKTMEPYEKLKEAIYEKRLKCHKYKLLADELKRLELVNGEKIDHPPDFSKDCADAVCGVFYTISKSNTSRILDFSPSFGDLREF